MASHTQEARGKLGPLDRALDRLVAILAVVGAQSW
jgi:hypothetical protein